MTTREAARPLRRYLRARVRAASLPPTYTITRDVTLLWLQLSFGKDPTVVFAALDNRNLRFDSCAEYNTAPAPCHGASRRR